MIGVLTKDDFKVILHNLGSVCMVISFSFLVPVIVAYYYKEFAEIPAFIASFFALLILGIFLRTVFLAKIDMKLRHAIGVTAISYPVAAFFGAIPLLSVSPSFIDAFFEGMAGWTTTGLSIIAVNADSFPYSINLWRHLMQYLGGLGIIVIYLVILSRASTGTGSTSFYTAEGRFEKLGASMVSTTRAIWLIYLMFLVFGAVALYYAGMSWFDAVTHSMSGIALGGFSTHAASIAYFDNQRIELVTVIIMIMGSINFAVHYSVITGKFREIYKNVEIQTFSIILILMSVPTVLWLAMSSSYPSIFTSFRFGFYQMVSALTTTGWATESPEMIGLLWGPLPVIMAALAMTIGASTGSTGGGIKCLRLYLIIKSIQWEIKKTLAPENAVILKKFHNIEDRTIDNKTLHGMFIMVFAYIILLVISTLITAAYGYPISNSFFESASSLATGGLSSGIVQEDMPWLLKIVYMINMWAGRLEVIPPLVFIVSLKGIITRN